MGSAESRDRCKCSIHCAEDRDKGYALISDDIGDLVAVWRTMASIIATISSFVVDH